MRKKAWKDAKETSQIRKLCLRQLLRNATPRLDETEVGVESARTVGNVEMSIAACHGTSH